MSRITSRVAVATAVLLFPLLSGCSVGMSGIIGIERSGDDFHAIVMMCPGEKLSAIAMSSESKNGERSPRKEISQWQTPQPDEQEQIVALGVRSDFLALLEPDTGFTFSHLSTGLFPGSLATSPAFTRTSVAALRDREILTVSTDDFSDVVVHSVSEMKVQLDQLCSS